MLKKHRVENVFQSELVKQKCFDTKLKKYGDGKYVNIKKKSLETKKQRDYTYIWVTNGVEDLRIMKWILPGYVVVNRNPRKNSELKIKQ